MTLQGRSAGDAVIARLAVRTCGGVEPLAARRGAERLLGGMALRPASLPPPAILCVRELRDPLPGTLALESVRLRPPPAWERAMQREVDRLARAATRPARGPVPAAAVAVVFADEAELLACLGGDLVAGAIPARWWWRLLIEGIEQPRRAAIAAWRRAVEHVPAALQALANRGQAVAFVRLLDDEDARGLAGAVAKRFALPAVVPAAVAVLPPSVAAAPASRGRAPASPWSSVAPEAEEGGLSTEQRALLGVALAIARAPALARSGDFVAALAGWRIAAASPEEPALGPRPERARQIEPARPSTGPETARPPADAAAAPPPWRVDAAGQGGASTDLVAAPGGPTPARAAAAGDATPPPADPPGAVPPPTVPSLLDDGAPLASPRAAAPAEPGGAMEPPRQPAAAPRERARPWPRHRDRAFGPPIETRLGGLFYLVNLALYLRLYAAGDRHDGDNLPLPLWDFVALVGRALLGSDAAAHEDDPVWPLLAELAGRTGDEPPGGGLLRVDVDACDGGEALPAMPPPGAPLEPWLARLLPYLRARLRRALAVTDEALPALLLAHRARVHATSSHLDVVLSLDALPIEIRLAGLDRDPGWVPAAGRFIAFHFE